MTTITACPADIADVLLQIMHAGIVMARSAGWDKNPELAVIMASHVHNLPDVLRHYDPEKLVYYWDRERTSYRGQFTHLTGQEPKVFEDYWAALEPLTASVQDSLPPTSSYRAKMEEIIHSVVEGHTAEYE